MEAGTQPEPQNEEYLQRMLRETGVVPERPSDPFEVIRLSNIEISQVTS
jgi:hypothetical protein